jgi:hypothetical protein
VSELALEVNAAVSTKNTALWDVHRCPASTGLHGVTCQKTVFLRIGHLGNDTSPYKEFCYRRGKQGNKAKRGNQIENERTKEKQEIKTERQGFRLAGIKE